MELRKRFFLLAGLAIAVVVVGVLFASYYGDWLWFQNLGFSRVFLTEIWTKTAAFAAVFLFFGCFIGLNIAYARKGGGRFRRVRVVDAERPATPLDEVFHGPHAAYAWTAVVLFLAGLMGTSAADSWMTFLKFFHGSPFGTVDPIFGKDLGFYVFGLPLYDQLLEWFFFGLVLTAIAVGFSYYIDQAVGVFENRLIVSPRVKRHLTVLAGCSFWGSPPPTGSSSTSCSTPAAAWPTAPATPMSTRRFPPTGPCWSSPSSSPCRYCLPRTAKWKWTLALFGVYVVALVGFSTLYPSLIEQYVVKPNELAKETPYIKNNIRFTRLGFGLDKAKEEPFPVRDTMSYDDIRKNEAHHPQHPPVGSPASGADL